ncbi:ABC transporter substrate-binding protein [Phytohabitans sp. ZYX-F-186]|uniref:ABC transporter substrate-binding protein n=1 Tax=Phytohabitans maris TaxID=3071409 RepID=A0ABU0ZI34_9ACTN|nr:ABC transporter substrate-binding protein [Phytohabitans sp. ZYX-F-186]MDQ7905960.1 ABC transporter substrate-binding protein [Phytohabitans sp. ZYX-F-186]
MDSAVLTRRTLLSGGAGLAAGGLLAGCGDDPHLGRPEPAPGKAWDGPVEQVSVLTGVGFQGREAPIAVAVAKGFFASAGLEVKTLAGRGTTGNLQLLKGGSATFATLDVSGAIMEMSRPDGINGFWLTSLLHRRNLACFMARQGSGIKTARDLAGRTVTFVPGGINYLLFATYATLSGFDAKSVRWRPAGQPEHAKLLAAGRVDAISQFVPGRVAVEAVAGPVTVLPFTDVLADIHGSAVAVTDQTATGKPAMVRRFNQALLRGLKYTLDHPDEAAAIYLAQPEAKTQKLPAVLGEIESLRGYVHLTTPSPQTVPLGHFDPARLMQNISILQGAKQIPEGLTPDRVAKFDLAGDPVT